MTHETTPTPDIDPALAAANARDAWCARRAERAPRSASFDSRTWLGEALTGARIGLALNDQDLLAGCMGEACALAVGSALASRVEAAELLLLETTAGELRMPAASPLASQWQQVVAIALACGDDGVLADLALLASHPVLADADNGGERYRAALAEALLSAAFALPGLDALMTRLAGLAETPVEHATVATLRGLLAAPGAPVALQAEDFDALALAALARERRHAVRAQGVIVPLPACRFPVACVAAPARAVRDRREPGWFFQVRALPGSVTEPGTDRPATRRLLLSAPDGRWQLRADFVDSGTPPADGLPPALDPGELLILADSLAAEVGERPPADDAERTLARERLADALAITELLRTLCDPATGRIPRDAFTTPDGRAEHDREPGRFEGERLAAVAGVYRDILDEYGGGAGAAPAPPPDARGQALAAIEVLRGQLEPLLRALAADRDGATARALRPRDGDAARVFPGLDADAVARAYRAVWDAEPAPPRPRAEQTELVCDLAPAGMLGHDNELSHRFPGGYRRIAPLLDPHRVWARWKFVRPGEPSGMAYDGLVWVDDHWAWFPKPYRVLAHLVPGSDPG